MSEIAIFDLDYTLTKRGTWGRFVLKNIRSRPLKWGPFALAVIGAQIRYLQGKAPRVSVKQEMMRWSMVGSHKDDLRKMADEFADIEIERGLRPGALDALERHRDAGHTIIIASAAVCVIVEAIAQRLGIVHFVATEMKWENDRLALNFATKNCYGAEKLTRVKQLFNQNPDLKQSDTIITMYSDSYSDLEILRFSDKGVAVNADRKLKVAAKGENFEIVDW